MLYWASESAAKHLWGRHAHTLFLGRTKPFLQAVHLTLQSHTEGAVPQRKSRQCGPVRELGSARTGCRRQRTAYEKERGTTNTKQKKRTHCYHDQPLRLKSTFTGTDMKYMTQHDLQVQWASRGGRQHLKFIAVWLHYVTVFHTKHDFMPFHWSGTREEHTAKDRTFSSITTVK